MFIKITVLQFLFTKYFTIFTRELFAQVQLLGISL
jgi:hypothetical protein